MVKNMGKECEIKFASGWVQDGKMWRRACIVVWYDKDGNVVEFSTHSQWIEGNPLKATIDHLGDGSYFYTKVITQKILDSFNRLREDSIRHHINKWQLGENEGKPAILIKSGCITNILPLQ